MVGRAVLHVQRHAVDGVAGVVGVDHGVEGGGVPERVVAVHHGHHVLFRQAEVLEEQADVRLRRDLARDRLVDRVVDLDRTDFLGAHLAPAVARAGPEVDDVADLARGAEHGAHGLVVGCGLVGVGRRLEELLQHQLGQVLAHLVELLLHHRRFFAFELQRGRDVDDFFFLQPLDDVVQVDRDEHEVEAEVLLDEVVGLFPVGLHVDAVGGLHAHELQVVDHARRHEALEGPVEQLGGLSAEHGAEDGPVVAVQRGHAAGLEEGHPALFVIHRVGRGRRRGRVGRVHRFGQLGGAVQKGQLHGAALVGQGRQPRRVGQVHLALDEALGLAHCLAVPGQVGVEHQEARHVVLGGRAVGVALDLVLGFLEDDEADRGAALLVHRELGPVGEVIELQRVVKVTHDRHPLDLEIGWAEREHGVLLSGVRAGAPARARTWAAESASCPCAPASAGRPCRPC